MCEYCHLTGKHHPSCPNAPEPRIRGHCCKCDDELREDYDYYTDNEDNEFCSKECAIEYHEIRSKEWD